MHWRVSTELRYENRTYMMGLEMLTTRKAAVYDATRRRLLRGREDMLGLVAAQLKFKVENKELQQGKAIWVDVSLF